MLKKIQGFQTDLSTFRFLCWVRNSMIPIALMQGFMYLLVFLQEPAWASQCSGALQKGPCQYPCWCKDPMGSQTCPEGLCAPTVLQTGRGSATGLQSLLWSGCSRPAQRCFLYWQWRRARLSGQPAPAFDLPHFEKQKSLLSNQNIFFSVLQSLPAASCPFTVHLQEQRGTASPPSHCVAVDHCQTHLSLLLTPSKTNPFGLSSHTTCPTSLVNLAVPHWPCSRTSSSQEPKNRHRNLMKFNKVFKKFVGPITLNTLQISSVRYHHYWLGTDVGKCSARLDATHVQISAANASSTKQDLLLEVQHVDGEAILALLLKEKMLKKCTHLVVEVEHKITLLILLPQKELPNSALLPTH